MSLVINNIESIITLVAIFMAALISPGPDFALIVKNSLTYSRKTALYTAFGISLGEIVHNLYILIGVGELLVNNVIAMKIFTYIGASYLVYIGYKGITAKVNNGVLENVSHKHDISSKAAVFSGIITCVFNPKAVLFITSMFAVVVKPGDPPELLFLYGLITFMQTFLWYSIVATLLSGETVRNKIIAIEHWIHRITGVILISIGVMLLI
jgi:threonine/homoserine/homoserine lactone efflux protein